MKRAIFGIFFTLALVSCKPPLSDGAFMGIPDADTDKNTVAVGEAIAVTITGSFITADDYYLEESVQPNVTLGACLSYASDVTTEGGLCPGGEKPLPKGLRLLENTTIANDFGDVVVKRGETQNLEHTFVFTSDNADTFEIVPAYLFKYDAGLDPYWEPGAENIIQVTFE